MIATASKNAFFGPSANRGGKACLSTAAIFQERQERRHGPVKPTQAKRKGRVRLPHQSASQKPLQHPCKANRDEHQKAKGKGTPHAKRCPYGRTVTPDIWHVAIPHKGTKKDDRDLWHQKSMTTCEMNCSQGEHQLKLIIEHCSKDFAPAVLLRPSP